MSLKVKLTSTIVAFLLILGLTIMGVFAAPTATILLGGTISFKATDVHARVSGTITGSQESEAEAGKELALETLEFNSGKETDVSSWADTDITFQDSGAMVTIKIVIENLATDRMLYASVADSMPSINNVTKTMKQLSSLSDATGTDYTGDVLSIPANSGNGTNVAYVQLTLQVTNPNASLDADASYGYQINLNNEEPEVAEKLVYTLDASTKTASVKMSNSSITGDIVIPENVTGEDGETYTVTAVEDYAFFDFMKYVEDVENGVIPEDADPELYLPNYAAKITSLEIPATVTSVGDMAFAGNQNLDKIKFKKAPVSVGGDILAHTPVREVVIESGDIPTGMFNKAAFTKLVLDGVTSIANNAFIECDWIEEVTIADSVTTISGIAFIACDKLTTIIMEGEDMPTIDNASVFGGNVETIKVPSALFESYKIASVWSGLVDLFVAY